MGPQSIICVTYHRYCTFMHPLMPHNLASAQSKILSGRFKEILTRVLCQRNIEIDHFHLHVEKISLSEVLFHAPLWVKKCVSQYILQIVFYDSIKQVILRIYEYNVGYQDVWHKRINILKYIYLFYFLP